MKENKEKRSRNKYYGDGGGGDGGRLKQSQQRIFLNMKKTKYKRINYISAIRCGFQHLLLGMGCACRSFTVARMDAAEPVVILRLSRGSNE